MTEREGRGARGNDREDTRERERMRERERERERECLHRGSRFGRM